MIEEVVVEEAVEEEPVEEEPVEEPAEEEPAEEEPVEEPPAEEEEEKEIEVADEEEAHPQVISVSSILEWKSTHFSILYRRILQPFPDPRPCVLPMNHPHTLCLQYRIYFSTVIPIAIPHWL